MVGTRRRSTSPFVSTRRGLARLDQQQALLPRCKRFVTLLLTLFLLFLPFRPLVSLLSRERPSTLVCSYPVGPSSSTSSSLPFSSSPSSGPCIVEAVRIGG